MPSQSDNARVTQESRQIKASAGFHCGHSYSATIAAAAFRAFGIGYCATREKLFAENRTQDGDFVDSLPGTLTTRPPRALIHKAYTKPRGLVVRFRPNFHHGRVIGRVRWEATEMAGKEIGAKHGRISVRCYIGAGRAPPISERRWILHPVIAVLVATMRLKICWTLIMRCKRRSRVNGISLEGLITTIMEQKSV